MNKNTPATGEVFGDQVVISQVPEEKYPPFHRLAGRVKPPSVVVRCSCGAERPIPVRALNSGSVRCVSCSQKARHLVRRQAAEAERASIARGAELILAMAWARSKHRDYYLQKRRYLS